MMPRATVRAREPGVSRNQRFRCGCTLHSLTKAFCWIFVIGVSADHIRWLLHTPEIHACEILSDDPEGKQLRSREQRNDGCKKRKPGNGIPMDQVAHEHVAEHRKTEQGERESNQASHLQRQRAEASHHV